MTQMVEDDPVMNAFWAGLPAACAQRIRPYMEFVRLSKGGSVYELSHAAEYAYFPTTATLALTHLMRDGESSVVSVVGREGVVGIMRVLGDASSPQQAVVQKAGGAWRISIRHLKEELAQGDLLRPALLYAQSLLTQACQMVVCNRHHQLVQQLCRWMLQALDRQDAMYIDCTQEMIAGILGVRRQGVAEVYAMLESAGIIQRRRGHVDVLDRVRLAELACECYGVMANEHRRLWALHAT